MYIRACQAHITHVFIAELTAMHEWYLQRFVCFTLQACHHSYRCYCTQQYRTLHNSCFSATNSATEFLQQSLPCHHHVHCHELISCRQCHPVAGKNGQPMPVCMQGLSIRLVLRSLQHSRSCGWGHGLAPGWGPKQVSGAGGSPRQDCGDELVP